MLTVGMDTYVTVGQATEYIEGHYGSGDGRRSAWTALSDEDREVCLRGAAAHIGRLGYRGVKDCPHQVLAFPRRYDTDARGCERAVAKVPRDVMDAQVEEALELAVPGEDSKTFAKRNIGIQAFSIGAFSETYGHAGTSEIEAAVVSAKAQALLLPYAGGAFCVR